MLVKNNPFKLGKIESFKLGLKDTSGFNSWYFSSLKISENLSIASPEVDPRSKVFKNSPI